MIKKTSIINEPRIKLEVENVNIRYKFGDFKDIGLKEWTVRHLTGNYHVQDFMAVEGVTFKLYEGDLLGIIGTNGAGKSTLLKVVAGIMEPTSGLVRPSGNVVALLELASGFDSNLTVKENAYLRGAMLGYTQKFMDEAYEYIVDFAELKGFEDRPFKQLSSGMQSRLAFSIASMVQPEILILDEVLSVGDGAFQAKSAKKMQEIIKSGATTILVSHSLQQIRELCNKVLWLNQGKQVAFGETEEICDRYEDFLSQGRISMRSAEVKEEKLKQKRYDYLIVGAGIFGSVFAHEANKRGKRCLVVEKRNHVGGNVYTETISNIDIHKYGPHIYHTNNKKLWEYVTKLIGMNNFINTPIAIYGNELYNLPFNMNTFYQMWGVKTPNEAKDIIQDQISKSNISEPKNLEEQALSMVGDDVYKKLVKGYTEKQWGRPCSELPANIIKRLPLRFTYNNNYFNDKYQGIPVGGYTPLIEKLLEGSDILLNMSYENYIRQHPNDASKIVYTGSIDEYFNYCLGHLEYRSLNFETEEIKTKDYQGNAVVNYTSADIPYTRIIEHKHFEFGDQPTTIITREYPKEWQKGDEPYYPLNDKKNNELYEKYRKLAQSEPNVIFGGRLGGYKYYNMDEVINVALIMAEQELSMA